MLASQLGHLSNVVLTSTIVPLIGTMLLDGLALLSFTIYALYHFVIMMPTKIGGPEFANGIDSEPDELYGFAVILGLLALAFSILGYALKYLFRIPFLTSLHSTCWGEDRRNAARVKAPTLAYTLSFILFVIVDLVAIHLTYDMLIPRDAPNGDPVLAVVLVNVLVLVIYPLGYVIFRYVIPSTEVYGRKEDGTFNVERLGVIFAIVGSLHLVGNLSISLVNFFVNSLDSAWITATVVAVLFFVAGIIYYFLRNPNGVDKQLRFEEEEALAYTEPEINRNRGGDVTVEARIRPSTALKSVKTGAFKIMGGKR